MKRRIEKVVVLGAGTMGARIAAHFANAGVPVLLLDIVPPGLTSGDAAERNKIVRAGLDAAKKSKPAALFTPALADKISIGNFEDDLQRCKDADWIIEVVAENLDIKKSLLARVAQLAPEHPAVLNELGLRMIQRGEAVKARELFQRATLADPNHPAPGDGYRIPVVQRTTQEPLAAYTTSPGIPGDGYRIVAVPRTSKLPLAGTHP